jgi:RNA recognition motif-containing protein
MNIFVAKLSPDTRGEDLKILFENYGRVDIAKVIMDRDTRQSKRYGFVEMPDDEEALAAIGALNDFEFKGSRILVKEALPRTSMPPREPRRNPGYNS